MPSLLCDTTAKKRLASAVHGVMQGLPDGADGVLGHRVSLRIMEYFGLRVTLECHLVQTSYMVSSLAKLVGALGVKVRQRDQFSARLTCHSERCRQWDRLKFQSRDQGGRQGPPGLAHPLEVLEEGAALKRGEPKGK